MQLWQSPPAWLLAGLLAIAWVLRFAARYGLDPDRPLKWVRWFDQGRYLVSAEAFAQGNLSPDAHWYSLAYPLIGAATSWASPGSPYLVADALLFALAGIGFQRAVRPLGITAWPAIVIFLLTTLAAVKQLWLVPWSTTLSAALTWWLLALALETLNPTSDSTSAATPPPAPRRMVAIGVLAGALPLSRIPDGLISATLLLVLLATLARQRRLTGASMAWLIAGALLPCVPYLLLHVAIYGPAPTPYSVAAAQAGFVFFDLPWRSYVLLITPQPWYPNAQSLIEALPWVLPGTAGLTAAALLGDPRTRLALGLFAAVALPYSLLALAFVDLHPTGLWQYNNAHYFKWMFPMFGAGLWLWLKSFRSRRGAVVAIAALALWLAPAFIRLTPIAVADDLPARMLLFRGSTTRDWSEAYFAPAVIVDSRGRLDNTAQFHQIPDDHGQRALMITRPFARRPRRDDPGEGPPLRHDQAPYGRYATRVSLGLPCWIKRSECQLPDRDAAAIGITRPAAEVP